MSEIEIRIKSDVYDCTIPLERRITVVKGDSGTGKSTFVEMMESSNNSPDVELDCILRCVSAESSNWDLIVQSAQSSVIIIDDENFVESSAFSSYYKKYAVASNLYFLIFARENLGDLNSRSRLPFSSNSILKMIADGKEHQVIPMYNRNVQESYLRVSNLCVLTEDTTAGYKFFKELCRDDIDIYSSTNGKSSIVNDLLRLDGIYSSIFVIFDNAAFGNNIEEFCMRTLECKSNIIAMSDYEGFEELLLLRTNLLSPLARVVNEFANLEHYANKYNSWEMYFESLLENVSSTKLYYQKHNGNLSPCFVRDCIDCNPHLRNKCDAFLDGDKFEELLKGTKYNFLLSLREPRTDNHHVKNGTMQDMNLF